MLVPAFLNHLTEPPLDFVESRRKRRPPRVDHDVPLRAEFGAMQAERFANAAFDTVADHCIPDSSRHGETDPDS